LETASWDIFRLTKYFTKDALSDIYIQYMRNLFNRDNDDYYYSIYNNENFICMVEYMAEYNHLLSDVIYTERKIPGHVVNILMRDNPMITDLKKDGPTNDIERLLLLYMQN